MRQPEGPPHVASVVDRPVAAGCALNGQETDVYAIISTGGHQVRVAPGATVTVDRVERAVGDEVSFTEVLLVEKDGGDVVAGTPLVAGARVLGIVEGEARGPKIRVFKKKRRKGMRRTKGHRSTYTRIRITGIEA
jgi:large subunit ribosomal protein L21